MHTGDYWMENCSNQRNIRLNLFDFGVTILPKNFMLKIMDPRISPLYLIATDNKSNLNFFRPLGSDVDAIHASEAPLLPFLLARYYAMSLERKCCHLKI